MTSSSNHVKLMGYHDSYDALLPNMADTSISNVCVSFTFVFVKSTVCRLHWICWWLFSSHIVSLLLSQIMESVHLMGHIVSFLLNQIMESVHLMSHILSSLLSQIMESVHLMGHILSLLLSQIMESVHLMYKCWCM